MITQSSYSKDEHALFPTALRLSIFRGFKLDLFIRANAGNTHTRIWRGRGHGRGRGRFWLIYCGIAVFVFEG